MLIQNLAPLLYTMAVLITMSQRWNDRHHVSSQWCIPTLEEQAAQRNSGCPIPGGAHCLNLWQQNPTFKFFKLELYQKTQIYEKYIQVIVLWLLNVIRFLPWFFEVSNGMYLSLFLCRNSGISLTKMILVTPAKIPVWSLLWRGERFQWTSFTYRGVFLFDLFGDD